MEPVIDFAREGDLDRLEELERVCFSVPWTREQLKTQLGEGYIFLVSREGDTPVGYVGAQCVLDEGYISNVAVSPGHRRRGIAEGLLRELERRGRERDLSFLTLEVRASNIPAIALYEKCGYERVGLRKNYYTHPKEDAIIMTLEMKK